MGSADTIKSPSPLSPRKRLVDYTKRKEMTESMALSPMPPPSLPHGIPAMISTDSPCLEAPLSPPLSASPLRKTIHKKRFPKQPVRKGSSQSASSSLSSSSSTSASSHSTSRAQRLHFPTFQSIDSKFKVKNGLTSISEREVAADEDEVVHFYLKIPSQRNQRRTPRKTDLQHANQSNLDSTDRIARRKRKVVGRSPCLSTILSHDPESPSRSSSSK